ncbi:hypothetical protein CRG98_037625 [Punica granatum]|uniref:Uncharacterized protein n=1 Tax=Punica granatum TaxID=22663 RepID=A0A2I0IDD8_PUNGR|nr:hypothetical protein CRG98_037625 [Punica granatum]
MGSSPNPLSVPNGVVKLCGPKFVSSGPTCVCANLTAWQCPPFRGERAMNTREKESPLLVYDMEVEGGRSKEERISSQGINPPFSHLG